MTIIDLSLLLTVSLAVWLWADGMRAREQATLAAKRTCAAEDVQFLDGTVAFQSLRLRRNAGGHISLRRVYRFEFSASGNDRTPGAVVTLGGQIESVYLQPRAQASGVWY